MSEWKPISTAPKLTKVLVAAKTDCGWEIDTMEKDKNGYWIHEGEPTFSHGWYCEPMYWMELPASPTPSPSAREE